MVVQHEHQHDETMLATIQLMGEDFAHPAAALDDAAPTAADAVDPAATCAVPGGTVTLGTDREPWAYDNERPAHTVDARPVRRSTATR